MNSTKRPLVMFLSADAGTGHTMAARALQLSLGRIDPAVNCEIVNSYKFLNLLLEKVIKDGYLHLIRILPKVYGYLYERKNKKQAIRGMKDWLNGVSARRLKDMIDEKKPDLIVCTHAFPCGVLSVIKQKYGLTQKILGVITDYVVSPFWIYPETDMYMVAADDLKDSFIARGVESDRVMTTGIPIDPVFLHNGDKYELRNKLGLDNDLPLLMIMGGGLGLSPVPGILRTLKKISAPFQAVIMMGTNVKLKKKIDDAILRFQDKFKRIKTVGYVDNVHEYMKASDLLVTKPGGMTVAEAVAVGLPMIITSPIPGQETRNTRYLLKKGVGIRAEDENELPEIIEGLLADPGTLQKMSEVSLKLAAPHAADLAARQICRLLNNNGS